MNLSRPRVAQGRPIIANALRACNGRTQSFSGLGGAEWLPDPGRWTHGA